MISRHTWALHGSITCLSVLYFEKCRRVDGPAVSPNENRDIRYVAVKTYRAWTVSVKSRRTTVLPTQYNLQVILSLLSSLTTMYLDIPIQPHRNHRIWLRCASVIAF